MRASALRALLQTVIISMSDYMRTLKFQTRHFNMVAERAKDPDGPSEQQHSEVEGSEQGGFRQQQQQHRAERKFQQQRFRKIRRDGPRDIQSKFNKFKHEFQDAVGTAPSEFSQLGSKRAQFDRTSPKPFLIPQLPETGSGQQTSARTLPSRIGTAAKSVSVSSEVNKKFFENKFQKKHEFQRQIIRQRCC